MQVYCSECDKSYDMQPQVTQLSNRIEKCFFICPHCNHEHVAAYVNDKIRKYQADIAKCHERINKKNLAIEDEMKRLRKRFEKEEVSGFEPLSLKMPLTKHWCLDRNCGFEETSHKIRDGWKCPDCNGSIMSQQVNKKRESAK